MSRIFENRYQAEKARRTEPFFNGAEKVIKVWGGYVLMDPMEWETWKQQK